MKVIARSIKGKEFLYTYNGAFFAPDRSAKKMAELLNKSNYQLKEGQLWHVHDWQYGDNMKVFCKLYFYRGKLKAKAL